MAPEPVVDASATSGVIVKVVVVSNRVARAQPDEPIAGGLAAALIPMVKESGAIWVGSSGHVGDATQTQDSFARIEALGTGALATVNMPAKHYLGYLRRLCQFGPVAGAAFAAGPDPGFAGELRVLSRDQRLHGARAAALQLAGSDVLGAGLSLPHLGRRNCASSTSIARSASSCTRRGPSGAP